jgi:hypothetical protein
VDLLSDALILFGIAVAIALSVAYVLLADRMVSGR